MMKKISIILLLLTSLLLAESSYYTQNGLGLTASALSVRSRGLGNTGGAVLDSISLTSDNPAFWYNFQTTSLQGFLNYSGQTSEKMSNGFRTSDLGGFAMKFPVGQYIGVAFGLKPEYRTNYVTNALDSVEFDGETIQFFNESTYKGGVSEAFLGLGYKFGSRLSFGIKSKLLFGNYNFENYVDKSYDNDYDSDYKEKLKISGLQTEFGVGWYQPGNFALGLTYSMHNVFKYKSNYDYSWGPDSSTQNQKISLPEKITVSLQKKVLKQLYFTSDFYYLGRYSELVEKVSFFNDVKSDDSYFLGIGLERVHADRIYKNYFKNLDYRLGLFYKTEPFYKDDEKITDLGLTLGLGIPMNFNLSSVDVSLQYIRRSGFLEDQIGKESIFKISVGITTGGLWFRR
jgi:hypothetical protein